MGAGAGLPDRILAIGLPVLIVVAPIPFGGRTPEASSAICAAAALLGACALVILVRDSARSGRSLVPAAGALAGLLALAALQILPLPWGLLELLTPETAAFRARALPESAGAPATLSLAPAASLAALGRVSAALAVFVAAAVLCRRSGGAVRIAAALCVAGTLQALFGLIETLSGAQGLLGSGAYAGRSSGTYVNPNHFAGLLELALPAALGLVVAAEGDFGSGAPRAKRSGGRIARLLSDPLAGKRRLAGLCIGCMSIALLLSRSRAGLALTGLALLVGLVLSARASPPRLAAGGGRSPFARRTAWLAGTAGIAALAFAPLVADQIRRVAGHYRAAPTDLLAPGGRLDVWADVLGMIRDHPLFGTGLGTFAATFPRYRGRDVSLRWEEAHNDYLQLVAELGLAGASLAALAIALAVIAAWRSLAASSPFERTERGLRICLACGAGALLLHEIIDFNLQIPANALAFAAACAAMLVVPATGNRSADPLDGTNRRHGFRRATAWILAAGATAGAAWGAIHPDNTSRRSTDSARALLAEAEGLLVDPAFERDAPKTPASLARRAEVLLEQALHGDPARAEAHVLMSHLDRRRALYGLDSGVSSSARPLDPLGLAATLDPYNPDLRLDLMWEHQAAGLREAVLADLEALAERSWDAVAAGLPIAWAAVRDPQQIGGAIDAGSARASTEESGRIRLTFIDSLLRAGYDDLAERRLRTIAESGRGLRADAYVRLSGLLVRRGDADSAARIGERLLENEGFDPIDAASVRASLASALSRAGSHEKAIARVEESLALSPGIPLFHLRAAEVYSAAHRPQESARHLEFLLKGGAAPEFVRSHAPSIHDGLARAYDRLGKRDEALRHWLEVSRLDPESTLARDRIEALRHGL